MPALTSFDISYFFRLSQASQGQEPSQEIESGSSESFDGGSVGEDKPPPSPMTEMESWVLGTTGYTGSDRKLTQERERKEGLEEE